MMGKRDEEPTSADLRNAVLRRMGPLDGCSYAAGAATLLDEYAAKLRADWERVAGWEARWRAEEAIRSAIENLYTGDDNGSRRTAPATEGRGAHPG